MIADEVQAKNFLEEYNSTAEVVWNAYIEASWAYNTDINEKNRQNMVTVVWCLNGAAFIYTVHIGN